MRSKEEARSRVDRNECQYQCGCSLSTKKFPRNKQKSIKRGTISQGEKRFKTIGTGFIQPNQSLNLM